jgi:predicted RNase H-like HicB family nuclease
MTRPLHVVIERDAENWHSGSMPALAGCCTQTRALDELMARMREAIALWVEAIEDSGHDSPKFVGVQRISGRQKIASLGKAGFETVRTTGSHRLLRHADGRARLTGLL